MPGLGRAHGNLGSLEVANFTDQNDIRIVAQNRAQPGRESQPNLLAHLNLNRAFELIFNRILEGDDFARFVAGLGKSSIECRRLAAARGPREQHQSLGESRQFLKDLLLVWLHPKLAEIEKKTLPTQDA